MSRHRKGQSVTGAGKSVVPAGRDGHERAGRRTATLGSIIMAIGAIIGPIAAAWIMSPADPAPAPPSQHPRPAITAPITEAAPDADGPTVHSGQASINSHDKRLLYLDR